MLKTAYFSRFTAVLTLKSSFSACRNRPLGRGRDFRDFRGQGRPNPWQAPNSQERAALEVRFLEGEDGTGRSRRPREKAGAGKRQLKFPPPQDRCRRKASQFYPEGCLFNLNRTAAHQHHGFPIDADEHSIERDCHQSLAPNHHRTYDFLVSGDPEMMFP